MISKVLDTVYNEAYSLFQWGVVLMDKIDRIKELVKLIDYHDNLYYNESRPEISDSEYDNLFYELRDLEKETGFVKQNVEKSMHK